MARRAQSTVHPAWLILAFCGIAALLGAGFFLFKGASDPFRTEQELDVSTYLDYAKSLRGNVYRLEATVQNQLAWDPVKGRLVTVEVQKGQRSDILPMLVPTSLNAINLQKGQRFKFKVSIGENGIIMVEDLRKS